MSKKLTITNKYSEHALGQKGFTLIEMILYMGLMAILLVVLSDLFVSILEAKVESESTSAVEEDGQLILARLAYDINQANTINRPSLYGSPPSSELEIKKGSTAYTYRLSSGLSGDLILDDSTNALKLNSSETTITNLSFRKLGNAVPNSKDTIQVNFTIESKAINSGRREIRNYQTTIGLR